MGFRTPEWQSQRTTIGFTVGGLAGEIGFCTSGRSVEMHKPNQPTSYSSNVAGDVDVIHGLDHGIAARATLY
jgi:hypothetical protein